MWKQFLAVGLLSVALVGCGTDITTNRTTQSTQSALSRTSQGVPAPSGQAPSGQCYDNVEDCTGKPAHHVEYGWDDKGCTVWRITASKGSACITQPVNEDPKALSANYVVFDNDAARGINRCVDILNHDAVSASTCQVMGERSAVG